MSKSYVDRVATLKITLDHLEPAIWRRVEIPLTTSLKGVHDVIQAVMLFENRHLFDFKVPLDGEIRRYGIPDPDGWLVMADARSVKLGKLIDRGVQQLFYTYDFGDNWEHSLQLEAVADADPNSPLPRFVDGENRAPPEDVGGLPGFGEFFEAMTSPHHPEARRLREWYGGTFNPTDLDIDEITLRVEKLARRRSMGKAGFAKSKLSSQGG